MLSEILKIATEIYTQADAHLENKGQAKALAERVKIIAETLQKEKFTYFDSEGDDEEPKAEFDAALRGLKSSLEKARDLIKKFNKPYKIKAVGEIEKFIKARGYVNEFAKAPVQVRSAINV